MAYRSLAIIGGTGLGALATISKDDALEVTTPYGSPSARLMKGRLGIRPVTFLARHGNPHALLPQEINYRANIHALVESGCDAIVGVNAVGAIRRDVSSGDVVVPHDIIDYTYGRKHTFGGDGRVIHVDMTEPYASDLLAALNQAAGQVAQLTVHRDGVYGCTQGPRLETSAEIDRMERDGCDVVGMTGMPEAALAREMGVGYAAVCLVVNAAAGRAPGPITLQQIEEVTLTGMEKVEALLTHAVESLYK
ncbi:MAG: S-methyl-5'-thioinosine phosphorylase [Pseudomonadales bacterium]